MIASQTVLVVGSLLGLVILGVLWAARFNGVDVENDDYDDYDYDLADDEVQDEDGYIHRPGQMPRKGDM